MGETCLLFRKYSDCFMGVEMEGCLLRWVQGRLFRTDTEILSEGRLAWMLRVNVT